MRSTRFANTVQPRPGNVDISSMNHIGVTHTCGRCSTASAVIIAGVHYCSSHGLDATIGSLVVDLRAPDNLALEVDRRDPVRALAS